MLGLILSSNQTLENYPKFNLMCVSFKSFVKLQEFSVITHYFWSTSNCKRHNFTSHITLFHQSVLLDASIHWYVYSFFMAIMW